MKKFIFNFNRKGISEINSLMLIALIGLISTGIAIWMSSHQKISVSKRFTVESQMIADMIKTRLENSTLCSSTLTGTILDLSSVTQTIPENGMSISLNIPDLTTSGFITDSSRNLKNLPHIQFTGVKLYNAVNLGIFPEHSAPGTNIYAVKLNISMRYITESNTSLSVRRKDILDIGVVVNSSNTITSCLDTKTIPIVKCASSGEIYLPNHVSANSVTGCVSKAILQGLPGSPGPSTPGPPGPTGPAPPKASD